MGLKVALHLLLLSWIGKCNNQDLLSHAQLEQLQCRNIGSLRPSSPPLLSSSLLLRLCAASLLPASTFSGFFVVTCCGSLVTCCGSVVFTCCSSDILLALSADEFFQTVYHLNS